MATYFLLIFLSVFNFLGALLAIAVAALAGCATMTKKPHPDDLNYHQ